MRMWELESSVWQSYTGQNLDPQSLPCHSFRTILCFQELVSELGCHLLLPPHCLVSWNLVSTCCLLYFPCSYMVALLTTPSFKFLHCPARGAVVLWKTSCFTSRFGANSLTLVFLILDSCNKHWLFLRFWRWGNVVKRSMCFSVHSQVSCSFRLVFPDFSQLTKPKHTTCRFHGNTKAPNV